MLKRTGYFRRTFSNFFVELLLIILGVLSALAVENFRESISDKTKEKEYLLALRDAIQSDTAVIKKETQRCFSKQNACAVILQLVEGDTQAEIPQDKLEDMTASIVMLIDPVYNTAIYEDLKSSGNLKIISNNELRNSVISYYADLYKISDRFSEMALFTSYNDDFTDLLDIDEFSFDKEISQARIIGKIKTNENAKLYLKRLQKRIMVIRNLFIYQMLPNSLNLLDKINLEISKK